MQQNCIKIDKYFLTQLITYQKQRIMLTQSPDCDRFIPSHFHNRQVSQFSHSQSSTSYGQFMKENLCPSSRLLEFSQMEKDKENSNNFNIFGNNLTNYCSFAHSQGSTMAASQVSSYQSECMLGSLQADVRDGLRTSAEKTLDAPGVRDDFYLNILDWSKLGPLAIALDNQVYLYTPSNISEICKVLDGSYASSVKFCAGNPLLSVGFSDGKVRIYDMQKSSLVRQLQNHEKRVSAIQFPSSACSSISQSLLYTGSKDRKIYLNDLHMKNPVVRCYTGHKGQICSLKIDPNHSNRLASGSNDNTVRIWDNRKDSDQHLIKNTDHKGAIKAIDWCPWKSGVIATAGGSGDRSIRIWSAMEQKSLSIKKTQTQISSLLWNKALKCLISSHGCPDNQIRTWKTSLNGDCAMNITHHKTLKGHTGRILQTIKSPNQGLLCSISADETLRFWRTHNSGDPWKSVINQFQQDQQDQTFGCMSIPSQSQKIHYQRSASKLQRWSMKLK